MPFARAGGAQAKISTRFGQNGQCVLAAISQRAHILVMISDALTRPLLKSINEMLETFYLHQYVFATAVSWDSAIYEKKKNLAQKR